MPTVLAGIFSHPMGLWLNGRVAVVITLRWG